MTVTIQDLNQRLGSLKTERSSYQSLWQDLNDYLLPNSARFSVTDRNRGSLRNSKILDGTATFAVKTLSAGMMAGITNPSRPWFALRVTDPALNEKQSVKEWLDTVRNIMSEMFISSNLYNVLPILYKETSVFGTGAFIMLENEEKTLRCYSYSVGSYYLGLSDEMTVDTCYREYQMSASQIVQRFGIENCSDSVKRAYQGTGKDTWFNVVYAIEPNDKHDKGKFESKFKKYRSIYYEASSNENKFLQEKGFDEFPIMAPRWEVTGEDVYGYGPGSDALPDIKGLQLEQKRKLAAIDKGISPPLAAPTNLRNANVSQLPGGMTFVDVHTGQQGINPIYQVNPTWLQFLTSDIQEVQQRIKRAFFEDLFLMISQDDRSNVTAYEIAAKNEEKMLILGPVLTRLNDELLDPTIDRSFNLLNRGGKLPPAPVEIQGMDLTVEYISTMAQAMKMTGISGIERLTQFTGQVAQTFPTVMDLYDADAAVTSMAGMLGTPPTLLRDEREVEAIRKAKARRQQIEEAAQLANSASDTTKKLADSQMTEPSALSGLMGAFQGQSGMNPEMAGQLPEMPAPGVAA